MSRVASIDDIRRARGNTFPWRAVVTCGAATAALALVLFGSRATEPALLAFAAAFLGAALGAFIATSRRDDVEPAQAVQVELAHDVSPGDARALLEAAVKEVDGIRRDSAPSCNVARLNTSAVVYELVFFIDDGADPAAVRSRALTRVWHAIQRHLGSRTPKSTENYTIALSALDSTPLFVGLPVDIKDEMASGAHVERWESGERVVRQGATDDSCFIVRSGALGVHVANDAGAEMQIATLGTGDVFGEMSLLTGEPRWATVRAEQDSELVRIRASALKTALSRSPDLVQVLAETVATRRDRLLEAKAVLKDRGAEHLPDAIRSFMRVAGERTGP